jgi:hypothetical protein
MFAKVSQKPLARIALERELGQESLDRIARNSRDGTGRTGKRGQDG